MKRLVIATANNDKARELREMLRGLPLEVVPLSEYPGAPGVVEW